MLSRSQWMFCGERIMHIVTELYRKLVKRVERESVVKESVMFHPQIIVTVFKCSQLVKPKVNLTSCGTSQTKWYLDQREVRWELFPIHLPAQTRSFFRLDPTFTKTQELPPQNVVHWVPPHLPRFSSSQRELPCQGIDVVVYRPGSFTSIKYNSKGAFQLLEYPVGCTEAIVTTEQLSCSHQPALLLSLPYRCPRAHTINHLISNPCFLGNLTQGT